MGPPSLNGGNASGSHQPPEGTPCFNGAAVSQRRKQCSGPGAPEKIPSFNGAAVSQRRKLATVAQDKLAQDASMGPPSLNGGNGEALEEATEELEASMGPPSLNGGNERSRVRAHHIPGASMGPPSLNGGNHQAVSSDVVHRELASMGPPSLNGGNLSV